MCKAASTDAIDSGQGKQRGFPRRTLLFRAIRRACAAARNGSGKGHVSTPQAAETKGARTLADQRRYPAHMGSRALSAEDKEPNRGQPQSSRSSHFASLLRSSAVYHCECAKRDANQSTLCRMTFAMGSRTEAQPKTPAYVAGRAKLQSTAHDAYTTDVSSIVRDSLSDTASQPCLEGCFKERRGFCRLRYIREEFAFAIRKQTEITAVR